MFHTAWRTCVARFCGASVSQPSFASFKINTLGLQLGRLGAPLHTCSVRSRVWQRPLSSLLTHTTTRQQQHVPLLARVAGFSSVSSASELSAAIAAAPTAAALQSLAAAAAASTPHQAWLVQQYKVQLLPRLEEEQPTQLIKALLFFAKLGPGHSDMFEQAVPVLYNQLGALTPGDLLALLNAYSSAATHSPAAYSHELFAALTEFLWEGLHELDARGLADIAAGYAAVDHYDDDEDFFAGVAAAALHKLESFCPEDLSRLVLGLAQLRFSAPDLNTAALAQLSAQLEAWPLSCIGRLLHGLAALQAPADPCVLERVANHVSSSLRNLRTSTDGKQLLARLGNTTGSSGSSSGAAAADAGAAAGAAAAVGLSSQGTLPGLAGGGAAGSSGSSRLGPAWQGFGVSRSSSSSSSSTSDSSSSSSASSSSSSRSVQEGAASIFAAASSSSRSMYSDPPGPPQGGVTHVCEQECELGPDYITVTSYSPDGHIITTYIKKATAGSSLGLDAIGRSMPNRTAAGDSSSSSSGRPGSSSGYRSTTSRSSSTASSSSSSSGITVGSTAGPKGAKLPPGTRAVATSSRGWQPRIGSNGSSNAAAGGPGSSAGGLLGSSGSSGGSSRDEGCPASWQWSSISSDCRPVYDDAPALTGALVDCVWAFAMLGHVHSGLAKECFRALALVAPEVLTEWQLACLWAAHMRYQQLGHVVLDPNPLLAESYSVFAREVSRAAPRTLSLPSSLQPQAAAEWLLTSIRHSPEYHQQQQQQQQQQLLQQQVGDQQQQQQQGGGQQQQQQQPQGFSSWKYRDPSVLTQQGLEASVRQALVALGLPVGPPCVTLDGLERVGLPLKHNGVCIAWQVLPPSWCTRNPPHSPTAQAAAQRWALQYRGYCVLQVSFAEWAAVLEAGDALVAAGFLQHRLDSVASVRAPHVPNF